MEPDRYLDFAQRYHALANTAFNFFSVVSIALIGWVVTIATAEGFDPATWAGLRWLIAGLYLGATVVAAAGQAISSRRANAAFRIARHKLGAVEEQALARDVALLTTPYRADVIISAKLAAAGVIAVGVVVLLGPR